VIGPLQLDGPGRNSRDERVLEGVGRERGLEGGEVGLDRGVATVGDGTGAHGVDHLQLRLPGRGRRVLRAALDLAIGLGEALAVPAPGRPAPAARQIRPQLEPGQPIGDVLGEPGLRILPVAGHVDPALRLHPHGLGDVPPDQRPLALGEGLPVRLALKDVDDLLGSDEAADVGGEDAVLTMLHRVTPSCAGGGWALAP
jgi:hypothetical protein